MDFSAFFQLWFFLAVGAIYLIALALIAVRNRSESFALNRLWYFTAFILLGGLAMFTARNYVFPDKSIFSNSKYHILEHNGFQFKNKLALVQSRYADESLWDNKTGIVTLERDSSKITIDIKNYYEPFYLSEAQEKDFFKLQNNIINEDISDGFTLRKGDTTILELKIIPISKGKKDSCLYLSRTNTNAEFDTSTFTLPVYRGYPLMDILLKTPNIQLSDELRLILGESLLVRDYIKIENRNLAKESASKNESPLRFFPQGSFYALSDVSVNNSQFNPDTSFHLELAEPDNILFYSGIGFSKTDVFRISLEDTADVRLNFIMPKMQPLRDTSEQMFLTSSIDEVKNHDLKAGYLFNIFESPKNWNNFNATLRHSIGSFRDAMFFKVKDLYANEQDKEIFPSDTLIVLKSQNAENDFRWLFQFKNLRETNSFQLKHINYFIFIFILLIGLRLFFDTRRFTPPFNLTHVSHIGKITAIELAVYVVIFCFSVVRLILVWRMSTFVPIEDIDAGRFYKLRDGYSVYWWTQVIVILVFILIISVKLISDGQILKNTFLQLWKKIRRDFQKIKENIRKRFFKNNKLPIRSALLLYFSITITLLFVFSKILPDFLARLLNIPLPILAYFIFDFFLIKSEEKTELPHYTPKYFRGVYKFIFYNNARITLWLIAFTYLAVQDSGFSIIFLLYGLIHHIFSIFFFKGSESRDIKWLPWIYIPFVTILFYLFLHWQGEILLSAFNDTFIWMLIISVLFCLIGVYIATNPFLNKGKYGISVLLFVTAIFLTLGSNQISDWLNENKSYVKYRAEIQLPDKSVEDLIKEHKFQSTDITYILRSAHNQWFINLYNNNPPDKYFTLQPHFNQGSSFTTQTTDLVVTRYLIAEHPKAVIFILMFLLFLLPLIYSFELNLKEPKINFSILGVFILLFSIALFVCLSATNRIIFFGQDFPFLSLTSKIAIAFPILVFLIAIFNSWNQKELNTDDVNEKNKFLFLISISVIALSCVSILPSKNKEKDESHFNISELIEKTAIKIDAINDEFADYQYNNRTRIRGLGIDNLINEYAGDENQSEKLHLALNDTTDKFLSSLLVHFISPLTNKWDPNELIHVRKRGSYYNITVNRRYYFIPSFKREQNRWEGNLLAAKTENKLGFLNKNKRLFVPDSKNNKIIPDILDLPASKNIPEIRQYRDSLNNISIMKLDPSWTDNDEALYLIKSDKGDYVQNKANFHIYNDTLTIQGKSTYPAIRLLPGDLLEMSIKQERSSKAVVKWKVVEENEKYLAKNIWMNGKQSMFYPLGKEFMWSYNFANVVSQVWSDSANIKFRNTDIRVSIDYDLTQKFYDIIDNENKSKLDISDVIKDKLIAFRNMDLAYKKNPNNSSEIFLLDNKIYINHNSKYRNNPKLKEAVNYVNKNFHPINPDPIVYNGDLVKTINEATEKKFDYSAVVIDGYGRIRTLFDYSRYSKTDPNNIKDFNRFLSELYKQSSVATEKDFFGNKALMTINPGPGSSFKPVAFTAVSSKLNFGWENLKIEAVNPLHIIRPIPKSRNNKTGVAFYGGKNFKGLHEPYWNLETYNLYGEGLSANRYIVHSNNLFHSAVIFLGSQSENVLKAISNNHQYDILFKDITNSSRRDSSTFPVIHFQNQTLILDPDKWLQNSDFFGKTNSVLASGLEENFHLIQTSLGEPYVNYFNAYGNDSLFNRFFNRQNSSGFIWSYPEQSTFYQIDRTVNPRIRNGLIQPSLGSFPLKVTPLNMATMGMRLATLNRSNYITTLSPDSASRQEYQFFSLDNEGWDTTSFLKYYQQNVLHQLYDVIYGGGTAARLKSKLSKYAAQGYFFYAKTGTINVEDNSDERGKHLLVIITNKKIDNAATPLTIDELRNLRYYVIFMSYHGIDKDEFDIGNFGKIISAVMDSELFTKYMNEGK